MAPGGAVAKITGKEGLEFTGKARTFDTEDAFVEAVEKGEIKKGEKTVVVLRYLGPKGGPGESVFLNLSFLALCLLVAAELELEIGRFPGVNDTNVSLSAPHFFSNSLVCSVISSLRWSDLSLLFSPSSFQLFPPIRTSTPSSTRFFFTSWMGMNTVSPPSSRTLSRWFCWKNRTMV